MSTSKYSQSKSPLPLTFNNIVEAFRSIVEQFPDQRTGDNLIYSMADAAMGAFSVFFTQSPSFLDFQRSLKASQGCSNAQSLLGMVNIPSDNQIRNLLDSVPPKAIFPLFSYAVNALHESGHLDVFTFHESIPPLVLIFVDIIGLQWRTSTDSHLKAQPH